MRHYTLIILLVLAIKLPAQTLGGNAVFNFLSQSNTAVLSALGGVNVSAIGNNAGITFHNPALLRDGMHQQLDLSFNAFLAGIKNYSLTTAWHLSSAKLNIGMGVNYFNYGEVMQADASGNILGSFRPRDYVVQVMASRQYHERWWYGLTMKFANSAYGQFRSAGLAFDVGVAYYDIDKEFQASIVVKNMGTQLKTYDGSNFKEELPFDLQAGITQRLKNAPIQFSLTAHHLHRFNIYYNDTSFRASEGDYNYKNNTTLQKMFSHLVLSTQLFLGEKVELTAGYNFLRRQDLNAYNLTSGFNGFSLGTGILLKNINIRYATGFYQSNLFHQFTLNLH